MGGRCEAEIRPARRKGQTDSTGLNVASQHFARKSAFYTGAVRPGLLLVQRLSFLGALGKIG